MPDGISRFFSTVKKEFLNFANVYSAAVKSGANMAGKQIIEEVDKLDQPSDLPTGKLIAAIKIGVQHASEQMVSSSMDFVDRMKKNAANPRKKS
jgi:hypothetical protein